MKARRAKTILRSARRLADAAESLEETGDHFWVAFLKRESNILLRRVLKFWVGIRLRRIK